MKYNHIDGIMLYQFNEIMNDLGYFHNEVFRMLDIDKIPLGSQWEVIKATLNGERFGYPGDPFDLKDRYFTYNGYELLSIPEHYIREYMNKFENIILEYANDNEIKLCGVEEEEE